MSLSLQTVHILQHFIWVLTIYLGTSIQRVIKYKISNQEIKIESDYFSCLLKVLVSLLISIIIAPIIIELLTLGNRQN